MQRPIVFLATSDPKFESMAINAILGTKHGARPAHDLDQAYRALSEGAENISLAVVDVTRGQFGRQLLRALNGARPDFPILTITDAADPLEFGDLDGLVLMRCEKSAPAEILREEIREMCLESTRASCPA